LGVSRRIGRKKRDKRMGNRFVFLAERRRE
jgi:hypothetical protein